MMMILSSINIKILNNITLKVMISYHMKSYTFIYIYMKGCKKHIYNLIELLNNNLTKTKKKALYQG